MDRTVKYGIQNFFVYPITNGDFSSGIEQLGVTSMTISPDGEDSKHYADNRLHKTIPGTTSISGTLETFQIDDNFRINALGEIKNLNGSFSKGKSKKIGVAFVYKILDGDENERLAIRTIYNLKFGNYEETYNTTADTSEPEIISLPFSGDVSDFVVDSRGNYTSGLEYLTEVGTSEIDIQNMLAEIPLPTTDIAALGGASLKDVVLSATSSAITMDYTLALNAYTGDITANLIDSISNATLESGVLTEGTNSVTSTVTLDANTSYTITVTNEEGLNLYTGNIKTGILPAPTPSKSKSK